MEGREATSAGKAADAREVCDLRQAFRTLLLAQGRINASHREAVESVTWGKRVSCALGSCGRGQCVGPGMCNRTCCGLCTGPCGLCSEIAGQPKPSRSVQVVDPVQNS